MASWVFFLVFFVPGLAGAQAPLPCRVNRTELDRAMAHMQDKSYHGFVILLKLLDALPSSTLTAGTTFLMPSNKHLSDLAFTRENLGDFVATHLIPFALTMKDLMQLPDGSMVPSGAPQRMFRITNGAGSSLVVNNARIVAPNICAGTVIACHGISAPISWAPVADSRLHTAVPKNVKRHRSKMMVR